MQGQIIERAAVSAADHLIKGGVIEKGEEELYSFGIKQLLLFLVNMATTAVIGLLCGMVWQSFVFTAAYIPLRRYAGGYHAKTPGRCYCLSTLLVAGVLLVLKYMPFSKMAAAVIVLAAAAVILLKAPVESVNKPLSEAETAVYRRKARVLLGLECLLAAALSAGFSGVAGCIAASVVCSGLLLAVPGRRTVSGRTGKY